MNRFFLNVMSRRRSLYEWMHRIYHQYNNWAFNSSRRRKKAVGSAKTNLHTRVIRNGADVNARDPEGFTPLHFTFVYRPTHFFKILQLLLFNGASINAATFVGGYTPLHFACKMEDPTLVQFLIQKGADVNMANTDLAGSAPLHFSVHPDISAALIDAGACISFKNVKKKKFTFVI